LVQMARHRQFARATRNRLKKQRFKARCWKMTVSLRSSRKLSSKLILPVLSTNCCIPLSLPWPGVCVCVRVVCVCVWGGGRVSVWACVCMCASLSLSLF